MMKKRMNENNMQITKRLTAILVAVVFVFGMMYMPAGIYAAEPEAAGDTIEATDPTTETVATEAIDNKESVTEEETTEEPSSAETEAIEAAEAESPADETTVDDLTDLVIVTDGNGNDIDLEDLDENAYDGFIYKIKDDVTKTEIKEMEEAIDDLGDDQTAEEVSGNEFYAADSIETISEVAQSEQIEYIEPNYIVEAMGTSDPYYDSYGWFLESINAPYVWEKGMFGEGVTIAVLDSGVKMDHPDFEKTDFTGQFNARATNDTDLQDVTDKSGHGTSVTGIIAASYDNQKGCTGIMPETTIMPVKVLEVNSEGKTTGSMTDVIKGIDYAVNNGADIINMSFGDDSDNYSLKEACQRASSEGVILVAPSGNDYDSKAV